MIHFSYFLLSLSFLSLPSTSLSLSPLIFIFYCTNRDTSGVGNTVKLFYYHCSSCDTFNDDISSWDVSSVTDMVGTIFYANSFNQALNDWDTSKVTDINGMFIEANNFNQAVDRWDLSSVTDLNYMFYAAEAFDQAVASWDVSKVKAMNNMFQAATSFNEILCWDLSGVSDTDDMFADSGTTYAYAIDSPVCIVTSKPSLQPISRPTLSPSPRPTLKPISRPTLSPSPRPTLQPIPRPTLSPSPLPYVPSSLPTNAPAAPSPPTSSPSPPPSPKPHVTSLLPSSLPSSPSPQPSHSPSYHPAPPPLILPSSLPSSIPTPAPSVTPWFLTSAYFELSAAAGVVGVLVATLFAALFRLRLGRWPPLLRTATAAVGMTSLGIEVLYSAAAASSSGQFCTGCPSEAGWTIFLLSGVTCGSILAYRLHQLRLALDTSVALGSVSIYALVILLTCFEGDFLVWLPWIETPATQALAGFPDDSSISFTTWSILLRKLPFLVFTASNTAHSGGTSTEYLTLIMTGTSLAISLSTKFLRRIAFSNADLDVFIGVRGDDYSRTDSFISSGSLNGNSGAVTPYGSNGRISSRG